ncbi:MAG: sulfatase-like hydrolase/transferase [Planctomycetota bacterium]
MPEPLNLLWIMSDQQRYDCVGAFGGRQARTPHLDRLAAEAVRFDRHYTTCPLCIPARSSLATGRYPHSCGATVNGIFWDDGELDHARLAPGRRTAGERLLDAGFRVAQVGVDHVLTVPPDRQRRAFDLFYDFSDYGSYAREKNLPGYDPANHQVECADQIGASSRTCRYSGPQPGRHPAAASDFLDFVFAREAADFLAGQKVGPWALFVYLWAPHPPLVWPEPYCSMYDPADVVLPPNVGVRGEGRSLLHDRHAPGQLGAFLENRDDWKRTWAAYLGGCTLVDDALGRVLAAARSRDDWDRTVVVFHPDHGEQLGAHRCFQKMVCYEDSIHLPLIICAPGASPGRTRALTSHVDILPTLLDYACVPLPDGLQGRSLRPLVEDPSAPFDRDEVFCEYNGNAGWSFFQRCVVSPRWKYIRNVGVDEELYDRQTDPFELRNIVRSAPAGVLKDMRTRLQAWMERTGDFLLAGS